MHEEIQPMRRFDTVNAAREFIAQAEQKGYETHLAKDTGRDGKPIYTVHTRRVG